MYLSMYKQTYEAVFARRLSNMYEFVQVLIKKWDLTKHILHTMYLTNHISKVLTYANPKVVSSMKPNLTHKGFNLHSFFRMIFPQVFQFLKFSCNLQHKASLFNES